MTKEHNNILEAKRSLKAHIKFMQTLVDNLNGPNKLARGKAMFAAWVIHRFFNERFMNELEQAVKESTRQVSSLD